MYGIGNRIPRFRGVHPIDTILYTSRRAGRTNSVRNPIASGTASASGRPASRAKQVPARSVSPAPVTCGTELRDRRVFGTTTGRPCSLRLKSERRKSVYPVQYEKSDHVVRSPIQLPACGRSDTLCTYSKSSFQMFASEFHVMTRLGISATWADVARRRCVE